MTEPSAPETPKTTSSELSPLLGLCSVKTGTLLGLQLQPIEVEVASRRGPAMFQLAGLAEAAVREARVRVTSAIARLGLTLEEFALTVSLAPADVRKSGSGLDLPVAIAILGAIGHLPAEAASEGLFVGELALDGLVRPVRGILPLLDGARRLGVRTAYIPEGNAAEASHVSGIEVLVVPRLRDLVLHLQGLPNLAHVRAPRVAATERDLPDLSDVRGQVAAKRALLIAAAGPHNLLMQGPPGSGKSLLARRLPSLLPPLDLESALETTSVHSVAGLVDPSLGIVAHPPFRAPHHTVSEAGLIGGGTSPRPGELSLAHNGVLFLDELPEFRRGALESLRQPLEDGEISIVRAKSSLSFPARVLLVAAMNPCPCGHYGNPRVACVCSVETRARYLARLSGPLLDRIELQVHVAPVDLSSWSDVAKNELHVSSTYRQRVTRARAKQLARWKTGIVSAKTNALLTWNELERVAEPDATGQVLLRQASEKLALSGRAYVRVLRVARTIADLDDAENIRAEHLAEALAFRSPDVTSRAVSRPFSQVT